MPKLQSLEITDNAPRIPFEHDYLQTIQASMPQFLMHLKLTFKISQNTDDVLHRITTLQEIIENLQSCKITLIGNYDINQLSETIDKSIKCEIVRSAYWIDFCK